MLVTGALLLYPLSVPQIEAEAGDQPYTLRKRAAEVARRFMERSREKLMRMRAGPRVRGTEVGCAFLTGVVFAVMGIWLLFYGLQYIWYAVGFLGVGLFVAAFTGILMRNQGRWGKQ
jgi:hypothetical protein